MADTLTKDGRSAVMSRVRGKDTKPEWILRCGLHRLGFRYTLKNGHLPGSPDIVLPKYGAAIFVHGCFWHRHAGCKDSSTPKTNPEFWQSKFRENTARDRRVVRQLRSLGWRVLVVWECELTRRTTRTVGEVAQWVMGQVRYASGTCRAMASTDRRRLLAIAQARVRKRLGSCRGEDIEGDDR